MNRNSIALLTAFAMIVGGCGKKIDSPTSSVPLTPAPASPGSVSAAASSTAATFSPILAAWQQGDKPSAINQFVSADWSVRPLFAPGSVLSLHEAQFKALSATEREAKSTELLAQLAQLKQLAVAVAQAGVDVAAKQNPAEARKDLTSVKQFGAALDGADSLAIVKLVGQALKKKADGELAKLKPSQ